MQLRPCLVLSHGAMPFSGLRRASVHACASSSHNLLNVAELVGEAGFAAAKASAIEGSYPRRLELSEVLARMRLVGGEESAGTSRHSTTPTSSTTPLLLDVRSPCEYAQGHVPGALNFPLFSDAERAEVGTLYKQQGHDVAVAHGLHILDSGWDSLLSRLPPNVQTRDDLIVYCKRGGMRSSGVCWLLSQAPFQSVSVLNDGYRSYRQWALEGASCPVTPYLTPYLSAPALPSHDPPLTPTLPPPLPPPLSPPLPSPLTPPLPPP